MPFQLPKGRSLPLFGRCSNGHISQLHGVIGVAEGATFGGLKTEGNVMPCPVPGCGAQTVTLDAEYSGANNSLTVLLNEDPDTVNSVIQLIGGLAPDAAGRLASILSNSPSAIAPDSGLTVAAPKPDLIERVATESPALAKLLQLIPTALWAVVLAGIVQLLIQRSQAGLKKMELAQQERQFQEQHQLDKRRVDLEERKVKVEEKRLEDAEKPPTVEVPKVRIRPGHSNRRSRAKAARKR